MNQPLTTEIIFPRAGRAVVSTPFRIPGGRGLGCQEIRDGPLQPYGQGVDVDARLRELGLELPAPMTPAGNYVPAATVGDLVYLSGAGPVRPDGSLVVGKVGDGRLDLDAAREAARLTGLQLLAALRAEIGDLGRVRRVARIFGMVNCAPGFNRTPAVIDGCSDLLVEVLGDAGRGARSAVGMAELPFDIAVEIEAVVQVST
jgi:enamine deaminase RidA (YjgF/YER057c/UK114 family)